MIKKINIRSSCSIQHDSMIVKSNFCFPLKLERSTAATFDGNMLDVQFGCSLMPRRAVI